jgi:hypothetical protein
MVLHSCCYQGPMQPSASAPFRIKEPGMALPFVLEQPVMELARTVGREAIQLPIDHACYQLCLQAVSHGCKGRMEIARPPALLRMYSKGANNSAANARLAC